MYIKILANVIIALFFLLFTSANSIAKDKCADLEKVANLTDISFNDDKLVFKYTQMEYFNIADRDIAQKNLKKAIINAKAALAKFLNETVQSEESLETAAKTSIKMVKSAEGDKKTATKEKVKLSLKKISSNSKAILTGVSVSDTCIDIEDKVVGVTILWTPEISKLTVKENSTKKNKPKSKNNRISSKIVDIIIIVEGNGNSLTQAINEAIKSAISQTYGQEFMAESEYSSVFSELNTYDESSKKSSIVSQEVQVDEIKTKTKGLVKSYKIIDNIENNNMYKVTLEVTVPKLETNIDPDKSTIIILSPKISNSKYDKDVIDFSASLKDTIIELINKTKNITVLDRDNLKDKEEELNLIAQKSNISELARRGNMAGADLIFTIEIINFESKIDSKIVGDKVFRRVIIDSEIAFKIIDVATTNIIFAERISYKKKRFKVKNASIKFGNRVGKNISILVSKNIGGGFSSDSNINDKNIINKDISISKDKADEMLDDIKGDY